MWVVLEDTFAITPACSQSCNGFAFFLCKRTPPLNRFDRNTIFTQAFSSDPLTSDACSWLAGNTCNIFQNVFGAIANCTGCNPPYKTGVVPLGFPFVLGRDVCYLPSKSQEILFTSLRPVKLAEKVLLRRHHICADHHADLPVLRLFWIQLT